LVRGEVPTPSQVGRALVAAAGLGSGVRGADGRGGARGGGGGGGVRRETAMLTGPRH